MMAESATSTVNLIDALPSLAKGLSDDARALARRHAVADCIELRPGTWTPSPPEPQEPGDLGLLVIEGFLTRDLQLAATVTCELVGLGDVLRPTDHDGGEAPVPFAIGWRVLAPTRLAILDRRAAAVLGRWPEVIEQIVRSGVKRAQSLGVHLAVSSIRRIEPRIQVMLWHLADRWGRVTPGGVHVPLRLTHQTLGQLAGAQRPSVTTALRSLARAGAVTRRDDGTWMLHGDPPDLLRELRDPGEAPGQAAVNRISVANSARNAATSPSAASPE